MKISAKPTIALVYDKLTTQYGGAEIVLQALKEIYPQAPLFTFINRASATEGWSKNWEIRPSLFQKFSFFLQKPELGICFQPLAFDSFDLSSFDIIISISSEGAKGVLTLPHQLHISYLLTPPRFLYHQRREIQKNSWLFWLPGFKQAAHQLVRYWRRWDQVAGQRPDIIIPISQEVARRVGEVYERQTDTVIYPPFPNQPPATKITTSPSTPATFWLCVGRHVPYKRFDAAIKAALAAKQHLVLVGAGPHTTALAKLAADKSCFIETPDQFCKNYHPSTPKIWFVSRASQPDLSWWYSQAQILLMPGLEDFGITGLESLHHGTPVATHYQSGIAELITHQKTGYHLQSCSTAEILKAITWVQTQKIKRQDLNKSVKGYSIGVFSEAFESRIATWYHKHTQMLKKGTVCRI